jgi:hypothetical protein
MFEYYILVILLNLSLKKGSQAKEDIIELKEQVEWGTSFDDAVGNGTSRPIIKSKIFSVIPPVSQQGFRNSFKLYFRR